MSVNTPAEYLSVLISMMNFYILTLAAVAQWIVLATHGQRVVGSNSIRLIGGVRKGIRPQLHLCPNSKSFPRPAQKKAQFGVSLRVWRL